MKKNIFIANLLQELLPSELNFRVFAMIKIRCIFAIAIDIFFYLSLINFMSFPI